MTLHLSEEVRNKIVADMSLYDLDVELGQERHDFSKYLHTHEPKLIGLHGPARSGKDTVGGMLKDAFDVKTVFFAEPMKEGLRTMMGLTDDQLYGTLKETTLDWLGKSPRQMLQTLGTDWGRELVNQDIWLILARRKIESLMDSGFHVAVTDVRFENEATMIRKMGGKVWHIRRENAQKVNAHESEAGLFVQHSDIIIDNNSTLADLFDEVCDNF